MTALLERSVTSVLGEGSVVPTEQSYGGDSFAWYLDAVPGTYARLGVHDSRSTARRLDLHASTFDVDERAIRVGALVLAATAMDALADVGARRA